MIHVDVCKSSKGDVWDTTAVVEPRALEYRLRIRLCCRTHSRRSFVIAALFPPPFATCTTGYPLLNVLYFSLSRLPLPASSPPTICANSTAGTVSLAANLLSGVFGSASAVLVCLTVEEWTRASADAYNTGAAAAAGLLFSFSPLAWEYNTGSEVFSLNNVMVAATVYLTARIVMKPRINLARIGAVVRTRWPLPVEQTTKRGGIRLMGCSYHCA